MIPVILSGGSGTRLWPVSRQQFPKQFCEIFSQPLQTLTLQRSLKIGTPWIVTGETLRTLTDLNLKALNIFDKASVIYEPFGKNTAPAIAALCKYAELKGMSEQVVGIFPSDHLIQNENEFLSIVSEAERLAQENFVVTIGIQPTYPETGYGYIQVNSDHKKDAKHNAFAVNRFHEKPALEKAQEFLASGNFFWNAGIFVFKVSRMIELFKKHQPAIWADIDILKADLSNVSDVYSKVQSISIDYAIMEKLNSQELMCIPGEFGWNDVGSWDAVANLMPSQKTYIHNSAGNFVFGEDKKTYSFVGIDDAIVVDTKDALLVMKKGQSQDVRHIVEAHTKEGSALVKEHVFEKRPWGEYEILRDTEHFKSKVIQVLPGAQISYQSHSKREEHWIITRGHGEVVLNDAVIPVKPGTHVHIPLQAKHRIRNTSKETLEFVEVQLGTYFGEDDIVRYQDDYKRK